MPSFFQVFKKHGLMIALAILLGQLAAGFVGGIPFGIIFFIGIIAFFVIAGNDGLLDAQGTHDPTGLSNTLHDPALWIMGGLVFLLFLVVALIIAGFTQAGSFAVTEEAVAENRSDIGTYFSKGFKLAFKMALVYLLQFLAGLAIWVLIILGIVLCATGGTVGIVAGVIVFLLCLVLAILLALAFLHAPAILVAEKVTPTRAIALSIRLLRQSFGEVFATGLGLFAIGLIYFFLYLLVMGASMIPMIDQFKEMMMNPHALSGSQPPQAFLMSNALAQLGSMFFSLIISPLMMAMTTLLITYRYHKCLRHHVNPEAVYPVTEAPIVDAPIVEAPVVDAPELNDEETKE